MTESQMGKYNCRAENEAGIAESICDVVVKKKTLSPVFLKRIQSKYLDIGQRLLLEVEIGGMPSPSIMWFFNDIEIVANETIQLRRMESHASLIQGERLWRKLKNLKKEQSFAIYLLRMFKNIEMQDLFLEIP